MRRGHGSWLISLTELCGENQPSDTITASKLLCNIDVNRNISEMRDGIKEEVVKVKSFEKMSPYCLLRSKLAVSSSAFLSSYQIWKMSNSCPRKTGKYFDTCQD